MPCLKDHVGGSRGELTCDKYMEKDDTVLARAVAPTPRDVARRPTTSHDHVVGLYRELFLDKCGETGWRGFSSGLAGLGAPEQTLSVLKPDRDMAIASVITASNQRG